MHTTTKPRRVTRTEVKALLLRIGRAMRAVREQRDRNRRERLDRLFRDHDWARPRPDADEGA